MIFLSMVFFNFGEITMNPLFNTIVSGIFILLGAAAVYTMMAVWGKRESAKPESYIKIHKYSGWAFVFIYIFMAGVMVARLDQYWEEPASRINLHITLGVLLFMLLLIKVTIPRVFPKMKKHMFQLGIGVFLTAYTLVMITGGHFLVRKIEKLPYVSHAELHQRMLDLDLGREIFIRECSACHLLENIMTPRSPESWEQVVNEMVVLADPRISTAEAGQILHYLRNTHVPEIIEQPGRADLIEQHCLPCHDAKMIYAQSYSREGWREVVRKMHEYDPEIVPLDKLDQIVDYLMENQPGQPEKEN